MYGVFVKLMEEKGLTPYRVAKETGITQATLIRWKTGKVNPSLETLQVLADYFHVSIDYLTGKTSEGKEKAPEVQKKRPPSTRGTSATSKRKWKRCWTCLIPTMLSCLTANRWTMKRASS